MHVNTESKPWYMSRTVIGLLVAVAATVLDKGGWLSLSDAEQQGLVEALIVLGQGSGAAMVLWGRTAAVSRLTLKAPPLAALGALALALLLSGCSLTGAGATVGGAMDSAGGAIDGARGIAEEVIDRVYAREVKLICAKSIRAHSEAIAAGIMDPGALPKLCPDIDSFVSLVAGAR